MAGSHPSTLPHNPFCSTALLGDNDGLLRLVDVRAPGGGGMLGVPGKAHSVHRRKINTIHIEPGAEQVCEGDIWAH